MTVKTEPRSWTLWNDQKVRTIRVMHGEAVWQISDVHGANDPMDRVGGPYRLSEFVDDDEYGKWFLVTIQDSYFPPTILVRCKSFDDVLEVFAEWVAEGITPETPAGRYCLAVTEEEMKDYDENSSSVQYTSKGMVDTDNCYIAEVRFHSCEV